MVVSTVVASGLVISESKQSIRSIALAALNSDSAKSGWNSCNAIASRLACSIPHLSTNSIAVLSLPRIRNRGPERAYTGNNQSIVTDWEDRDDDDDDEGEDDAAIA